MRLIDAIAAPAHTQAHIRSHSASVKSGGCWRAGAQQKALCGSSEARVSAVRRKEKITGARGHARSLCGTAQSGARAEMQVRGTAHTSLIITIIDQRLTNID